MIDPYAILVMPSNFLFKVAIWHLYYRNTQYLLMQCHLT